MQWSYSARDVNDQSPETAIRPYPSPNVQDNGAARNAPQEHGLVSKGANALNANDFGVNASPEDTIKAGVARLRALIPGELDAIATDPNIMPERMPDLIGELIRASTQAQINPTEYSPQLLPALEALQRARGDLAPAKTLTIDDILAPAQPAVQTMPITPAPQSIGDLLKPAMAAQPQAVYQAALQQLAQITLDDVFDQGAPKVPDVRNRAAVNRGPERT